ncbi:amidohydrolase family protein [Mycolicibacterium litorale]|uniref:Amidohydrolase n=1 Tax=Mycolicibacterium litorale TaxID=758802 RepID=A0AAD1MTI2_9MYCO|nr:amidohydrolase family protein [Mycolicibacterium litorale]MCV7417172.1 amidohydrolase family protein [Mycolicibacterium litorale]TDY04960.1 putative amidohydrolase YtcJ [Mycolicibacterium litorale]BBY18389.1 amidohydrolase [Mycolicibacterium litorale]
MLIQRATLLDGSRVDIRLRDRIADVAATLAPERGETVLDAAGQTVIPGLHDHHVHLLAAAAALDSVRVGPGDVGDRDGLVRALADAIPGDDGWIRAVGYHEAVAGPLDRAALDALCPAVPVRVQHRSGVVWTVNSAGLARLGRSDHPDGTLHSADPGWTAERRDVPLDRLSRRLARYGVTGVTDATPGLDAHLEGEVLQRLHVLAPGKRILHDDGLDLDELTDWITDTHAGGVPVAVHCVTAAQLVVTIAALRVAGVRPGDRIEHAAVVPDDCVGDLVGLGVTVVTQPNFVAERGDQYLADVPADAQHELWRVASLLRAGVPLAFSTDTPFGDGDPWAVMRAAVQRRTPSGAILGPREKIDSATAFALFHGSADAPTAPRTVALGQPADLCVVEGTPRDVLADLDGDRVRTTIIAGRTV